ncbi:hypothetical protein D6C91_07530 [Aureobasidium pullulans]|uniref:Uncharacterized protein n=1 Tax=Aureobasidium pullulans TaxID=5580 RepID=A0A4S9SRS9_AURPU|nr:hypothetical protein D6C91_07530 [Aureobasidium pullulans]
MRPRKFTLIHSTFLDFVDQLLQGSSEKDDMQPLPPGETAQSQEHSREHTQDHLQRPHQDVREESPQNTHLDQELRENLPVVPVVPLTPAALTHLAWLAYFISIILPVLWFTTSYLASATIFANVSLPLVNGTALNTTLGFFHHEPSLEHTFTNRQVNAISAALFAPNVVFAFLFIPVSMASDNTNAFLWAFFGNLLTITASILFLCIRTPVSVLVSRNIMALGETMVLPQGLRFAASLTTGNTEKPHSAGMRTLATRLYSVSNIELNIVGVIAGGVLLTQHPNIGYIICTALSCLSLVCLVVYGLTNQLENAAWSPFFNVLEPMVPISAEEEAFRLRIRTAGPTIAQWQALRRGEFQTTLLGLFAPGILDRFSVIKFDYAAALLAGLSISLFAMALGPIAFAGVGLLGQDTPLPLHFQSLSAFAYFGAVCAGACGLRVIQFNNHPRTRELVRVPHAGDDSPAVYYRENSLVPPTLFSQPTAVTIPHNHLAVLNMLSATISLLIASFKEIPLSTPGLTFLLSIRSLNVFGNFSFVVWLISNRLQTLVGLSTALLDGVLQLSLELSLTLSKVMDKSIASAAGPTPIFDLITTFFVSIPRLDVIDSTQRAFGIIMCLQLLATAVVFTGLRLPAEAGSEIQIEDQQGSQGTQDVHGVQGVQDAQGAQSAQGAQNSQDTSQGVQDAQDSQNTSQGTQNAQSAAQGTIQQVTQQGTQQGAQSDMRIRVLEPQVGDLQQQQPRGQLSTALAPDPIVDTSNRSAIAHELIPVTPKTAQGLTRQGESPQSTREQHSTPGGGSAVNPREF